MHPASSSSHFLPSQISPTDFTHLEVVLEPCWNKAENTNNNFNSRTVKNVLSLSYLWAGDKVKVMSRRLDKKMCGFCAVIRCNLGKRLGRDSHLGDFCWIACTVLLVGKEILLISVVWSVSPIHEFSEKSPTFCRRGGDTSYMEYVQANCLPEPVAFACLHVTLCHGATVHSWL